jgi:putative oxidoreductase
MISSATPLPNRAVAVISYPDLSDAGLKDHVFWGALLLVTLVYGPGKLAVDHWIRRRTGG